MKLNNKLFAIQLMLSWILFLSCAVNPVTGKRELMLLTTADEISMGKMTDEEIIGMYGIYEDRALGDYMTQIGVRMTPVTHQPNLPYSFKILDTDVVNAFAVPGGYVYFTRGILAYLNNEAEFAGVMGHELGHVNARHSAKMLSQAQLTQFGLQLGSAVSETFARFAGFAGLGVQVLFLRFSRDHEREADNLGVEYSTKIGYDANGMATFFETLEKMHPSGESGLPDWFSTHPNPVDRIEAVKAKTREWQQKQTGRQYVLNAKQYLTQLDGLIFGPDPRQGYVEKGNFYHPTMKFMFPIPDQWQTNNLPAQVQMVSPQQDGVLLFTSSGQKTVDLAIDEFITNTQGAVISRNTGSLQGIAFTEILSEISGKQPLKVISKFYQFNQMILIFHGYTIISTFDAYLPTFQTSMNGFKKLSDPAKLNVKPRRLKLGTVNKNISLNEYLQENKINQEDYETIALVNGMNLNDQIHAGSIIKLINDH